VREKQLRERAAVCRIAAGLPTTGGHETDRLLFQIAEQLEAEADELAGHRSDA
jgi:hypothetical protein